MRAEKVLTLSTTAAHAGRSERSELVMVLNRRRSTGRGRQRCLADHRRPLHGRASSAWPRSSSTSATPGRSDVRCRAASTPPRWPAPRTCPLPSNNARPGSPSRARPARRPPDYAARNLVGASAVGPDCTIQTGFTCTGTVGGVTLTITTPWNPQHQRAAGRHQLVDLPRVHLRAGVREHGDLLRPGGAAVEPAGVSQRRRPLHGHRRWLRLRPGGDQPHEVRGADLRRQQRHHPHLQRCGDGELQLRHAATPRPSTRAAAAGS